jgi:RHS repeat-associated protein
MKPVTIANMSPSGIKQGTFKVDANGGAVYQLGIEIPPGINGVQPKLALAYDHRRGNGNCGVGWSVSGLSAITRTNANYAVDGFRGSISYDANDRFELDGQRLINISGDYGDFGTAYYTEQHNWQKIVTGAGIDDGLSICMKNGEIWSYGNTADSRIFASGTPQDVAHIRAWALSAIEDLNGNRVEYSYHADAGAHYLDQIRYTVRADLAAGFSVNFAYAQRPDPITVYLGGAPITTSSLLSGITTNMGTNANANVVRCYTLNYAQSTATQVSRLQSIQLTDADNNALPPVVLSWQDTTPALSTDQPVSQLLNNSNLVKTIPVDLNGDGISDVLQLYNDANDCLNIQSFISSNQQGKISFIAGNDQLLSKSRYPSGYQVFSGDVNGDGLIDLMIAYPGGEDNLFLCIDVFINNGSSFGTAITSTTTNQWQVPAPASAGFYPLDVDGDGRIDLVAAWIDQNSLLNFQVYRSQFVGDSGSFATANNVTTGLNKGALQSIWPIDVNGDGMVDVMVLWKDGTTGELNLSSFITCGTPANGDPSNMNFLTTQKNTDLGTTASDQLAIYPADVNGDGMMDILQVVAVPTNNSLQLQAFFSDATGGFVKGPLSTFQDQNPTIQLQQMALNGGGQTNLVANYLDPQTNAWNFTVFSASPSGQFSKGPNVTTALQAPKLDFYVADVSGNGKADLLYSYQAGDYINVQPLTSQGPYPDLITTIADMTGGNIAINYAPLTDSSVYSTSEVSAYPATGALLNPARLAPAQFPFQEVMGKAVYVVSGYCLSNTPAVNRFNYQHSYRLQYQNARIDLAGRGWQGFQQVITTDLGTGLRNTSTYLQDFPYTGLTSTIIKEGDGTIATDPRIPKNNAHVLMSLRVNTYQSVTYQGAGGCTGNLAFELQQTGKLTYYYDYGLLNYNPVTKKYTDFKNGLDYMLAKSFAYDAYGNQSAKIWWGYINYLDPLTVSSVNAFPAVTPQFPAEVVYTFRKFQNDVNAGTWALGYLIFEKETANTSDSDITVFKPGDYNLASRVYATGNYCLTWQGHWDSQNNCWLSTQFTYDDFGNRLTEQVPGGATTNYSFEQTYHIYPETITAPPNANGVRAIRRVGYDPRFGGLVAEQDINGFYHITVLDSFGRRILRQGPLPEIGITADRNQCTPLVTGLAAFGQADVITLEKISYGTDTAAGIYTDRNVLQEFTAGPDSTFTSERKYSDGLGRCAEIAVEAGTAQGFTVSLVTYAVNGKPATHSLPIFSVDLINPATLYFVNHTYDVLGRQISQVSPCGKDNLGTTETTWAYISGQKTVITQAYGSAQTFGQELDNHFFNEQVRQVRSVVRDDNNAVTTFLFDALGRLLTTTDPQQKSNSLNYDSLNRKLSYDNADQNPDQNSGSAALRYCYDHLTGNLLSITDAAGAIAGYQYDQLGRITGRSYSDGRSCQIGYDSALNGVGQAAAIQVFSAPGETESGESFTYDAYGNAVSRKLSIGTDNYSSAFVFDPEKRKIKQTNDDGSVQTWQYECGQLTALQLGSATIAYPLAQYLPAGNAGELQYQVDQKKVMDLSLNYNATGILYGEQLANGSQQPVLEFAFTYDELGNLTQSSEQLSKHQESYVYNQKRLVGLSGYQENNYAYDNSGRLTAKNGNNYVYQSANCPVSVAGEGLTCQLTQDTCGKIISRTVNQNTLNFAYDGGGNLAKISAGGNVLRQILYDAAGKRIREIKSDGTITTFVRESYRVVNTQGVVSINKELRDKAGAVVGIETSGGTDTIVFYRRDHKGNITHVFDNNGALKYQLTYDGFGFPTIVSSSATNSTDVVWPQYEGRHFDPVVGLYYFGARYFDPVTGVFLSPDTRLGGSSQLIPGVWNRFAFELNNPYNHLDPDGHMSIWAKIGIGIGLTAVAILAIAFTGGAAAAVVPEAGVELAAMGGAAAGGEAAAGGAGVAAADGAAVAGGEGAAAGEVTAGQIAKGVVLGVARGAVSGAVVGTSTGGITYLVGGGDSFDGLFHAMEHGAIAGAISGVIVGGVAGAVRTVGVNALLTRVAIGAATGAGANVVGKIVSDEALDHQMPSLADIGISAATGAITGGITGGWNGSGAARQFGSMARAVMQANGWQIKLAAAAAGTGVLSSWLIFGGVDHDL